jgi:tight adherence protein B
MLIWLAAAGAFLTAALLVWALLPSPTRAVEARILKYAGPAPTAAAAPPAREPWRLPRALEAYLLQAGIEPTPASVALMLLAYMVGGLALGLWLHMAASGAAMGLLALILKVRRGRAGRVQRLAAQLPDALMLLASGTRAGLGFQQALQLAARETAQPLGGELARLERDLALGLTTQEALERLQTRLASPDGEMLCAALLVQRQTGGNLSELLLNLHHTIRNRQALHGQVRTLTAQGRLSGVILCCLPLVLAVLLWTMNRGYLLGMLQDPRGQAMAAAAVGMMAIGAWLISRIVRISL